jgi:carbon-monoxide dehydrogenase small subunit
LREIRFYLNGKETTVEVPPAYTLLETLRYVLRLTGTKEGCGRGDCGECTVLLDGVPVHACLTLMSQVEGRSVVTVEVSRLCEVEGDQVLPERQGDHR